MKRLTHWAIVMMIAARPAAALDWNQADPAASSAILARPSSGGAIAGKFDSYVLALEWTAAFCEGRPGLPECASSGRDRFDARNLALHGLWPDKAGDSSHAYGYCGVDAAVRALDRASSWCRMPAPGLSDSVASLLKPLMPGTASCLENHEWYKHGSCSGLTPDEYFSQACALTAFVSETSFGRFLFERAGQTITADALLSAFESGFGAGSRSMVGLICTKARGEDMLLEVRLRLTHPLRPAAELARMLLPAGGAGNCPASFKLDELPGL